MAVVNPIFDLSASFSNDNSIEQMTYNKIMREDGRVGAGQNPKVHRFHSNNTTDFLLQSRSYIVLQMKWLHSASIAGDVGPTFVNGAKKFIKRAHLIANGQTIDHDTGYAREWKNVQDYLNYNRDRDGTKGAQSGYHSSEPNDHATYYNGLFTSRCDATQLNYNEAYLKRALKQGGLAGGGREQEFKIPLMDLFPFLQAYDRIGRGVAWEIEIELYDDVELVQTAVSGVNIAGAVIPIPSSGSATGGVSTVEYWGDGAFLMACKVVPSIDVRNSLNESLNAGFRHNMEYSGYHVYRNDISALSGSNDIRISSTYSRPMRIYVMFQLKANLTNQTLDPLRYNHCGVNRLSVMLNGTSTPINEYVVNWLGSDDSTFDSIPSDTTGDRLRAYEDLLVSKGLNASHLSAPSNYGSMSYDLWTRSPVYVFNLNGASDTLFSGSSEISVKVDLNAIVPANMFTVVEYSKLAQIALSNTDSSILVN